ncbi:MAG: DUF898 family protein [Sulfuritalea sp.]|nr:DUF898 family protein [Sulfuritalea sp.]
MNATSCYETLGVVRDATPEAITAAYQRCLGELRASLNGPNPPPPERLDALRAAYQTLGNPAARQAHDAALSPPTPAVSADEGERRPYPFAFTGEGGEYFRIWIVNLFLSLITFGIYSAWAKVRRETFFHRNLTLDNSAFSYHGNPIAILKGRAIAVVLLIALSAAQNAGPFAYGIAVLALLPVVPWLIVRAFRFRAHNTSYRGLRFSFHGTYRQALTAFVGYGLLAAISFGLLFPLFYRQQRTFVLDNLRYGSAQFHCTASNGQFYGIFLKPIGLALAGMFAIGFLTAAGGAPKLLLPLAFGVGTMALMLFLLPYIRVRTTNLVWNHVSLERMGFSSKLAVLPYFGLLAGNMVLLLLTLGLYWPWARVRLARYRASCMSLLSAEALDSFVAGESANAAAVGDEVSELMDIDIAL